jgi:hypothetical protein
MSRELAIYCGSCVAVIAIGGALLSWRPRR